MSFPDRFSISIFLFVFAYGAAAPAAAQSTNQPTPPVDPAAAPRISESIVVTATGKEENISRIGASITVLGPDDIQRRDALSTTDLLRTVPGLIATRSGGVGTLTSVWVRGGESSYNKVLLDGIPLNEPGGAFNFASIAPENIERIEVLRGAHSALFGSDAMASVIQIFTARPTSAEPQITAAVEGGTYRTGHVEVGVGAKSGALEYSAFGSHLQTDNRVPNNRNRASTASGTISGQPSAGGLARLVLRGDFGRTGVPGATAFGRPDLDAFFRHRDAVVLGAWSHTVNTHLSYQAGYSLTATNQRSANLIVDPPYTPTFGDRTAPFQFSDFLYDTDTNLKRHHIDYRADAALAEHHVLTFAFAYDGERGVLTNFLSTAAPQAPSRNNTGTTFQYEGSAGSVSMIGGVRFEHNGSFGSYLAPRVALSWLAQPGRQGLGATRVKASAGLGIKEPTFLQSYSPSPSALGNPDLKPERSRGFDAGIEQRFARDRVAVEVTYFANHFDDLISTQLIDPATFRYQYFNIGETRARGLELSGTVVATRSLRLGASYTLLDGTVLKSTTTFSPVFREGQPLFRRPKHSGALQASWSTARGGVHTELVIVGRRVDSDFSSLVPEITSNPRYSLWNVSGDIKLHRVLSAVIAIENLAGRDYMDPLGYPALLRTVRAGLRARF
jgi:vitamin B12 transporter